MSYDFSGYATRHNIRCSDGRTIMPDAFKECDGQTVPLVWQHMHDSTDNVLGHAELENRPDGVYAYCSLNSTPNAENARELVKHGDICALSIYANRLQQVGQNVMHGVIREVSLVLAGANPGATIDNLAFAHADGSKEIIDDEACITFVDQPLKIIMHSDDSDDSDDLEDEEYEGKTIGEIVDTMNEEQKQAVSAIIEALSEATDEYDEEEDDEGLQHAESEEDYEDEDDVDEEDEFDEEEETIGEILDSLTSEQEDALDDMLEAFSGNPDAVDENTAEVFETFDDDQKKAVYAMIGMAANSGGSMRHAGDETIQDVIDTLDEEQKDAFYAILNALASGNGPVDEKYAEIFDTFDSKQKNAVYAIVGLALEGGNAVKHADDVDIEEVINGMDDDQVAAIEAILDAVDNGEDSVPLEVKRIVDGMDDDQKAAVQALLDAAQEDDESSDEEEFEDEEISHSIYGGNSMKYNVFDADLAETAVLSHDDMSAVFDDAPRFGSLKEAALQHGITDIEVLFPEAQAVNREPYEIARRMEWVSVVLNGVKKSPFSRIKSTAVNLTEDQARAKGYIKGRKKIEEQIAALRRVTTPQTIYKLQKLDRDDVIDITDFDVVAWMKREMRMMLDEEVARAILVGDGRTGTDPEKIFADHVRPVWSDDEMYTIHQVVAAADAADYTKMIDSVVRSRKAYKGSGNPVMFIGPDILTEMRLLKDNDNRFRYESDAKLAEAMRVSAIHEVELFDELTRTVDGKDRKLVAIILNLADYTCGADKGGEVSMFDDFDLDYNKLEYLIETRMSGALTQPKSAIAVEIQTTTDSTPEVSYVKVTNPVVADIDDYYDQDEYGRFQKTVDVAIVTGKTYWEIDE